MSYLCYITYKDIYSEGKIKKIVFLILLVFTTLMIQPIEIKADPAFVDVYARDGDVPRSGYQNTVHFVIENDLGTRALYFLQVTAICEIIYDLVNEFKYKNRVYIN